MINRKCLYCGNEIEDLQGEHQRFCSTKCRVAHARWIRQGLLRCARCNNDLPMFSESRICEKCIKKEKQQTLDKYSPEELLHYGKLQADKYLKSLKKGR